MLRPNFCRHDGRLVKLLLFSKLLDKSPRTFIYFTTFEKKRRVRSPLPHTTKLFGFWYNTYIPFGLNIYILSIVKLAADDYKTVIESFQNFVLFVRVPYIVVF